MKHAGSISSMTAVRSMPVGPAVTFLDDKHTPLELAKHPVDNHHHKFGDSPGVSTAVQNLGVSREAVSLGGNCGDNDDGNDGGMTAKDRARSLALSPNCRRCLSCEKLYDLVSSAGIRHVLFCFVFQCACAWRYKCAEEEASVLLL